MAAKRKATRAPGAFAYDGLDRVLHEKARLGIMTSLYTNPAGLVFNELKKLCSLTDGNLSRHLQILHEAGLIEIWKGFHKNRPQTLCRLTGRGRERFLSYLEELEKVLNAAGVSHGARRQKRADSRGPEVLPPNWAPA